LLVQLPLFLIKNHGCQFKSNGFPLNIDLFDPKAITFSLTFSFLIQKRAASIKHHDVWLKLNEIQSYVRAYVEQHLHTSERGCQPGGDGARGPLL